MPSMISATPEFQEAFIRRCAEHGLSEEQTCHLMKFASLTPTPAEEMLLEMYGVKMATARPEAPAGYRFDTTGYFNTGGMSDQQVIQKIRDNKAQGITPNPHGKVQIQQPAPQPPVPQTVTAPAPSQAAQPPPAGIIQPPPNMPPQPAVAPQVPPQPPNTAQPMAPASAQPEAALAQQTPDQVLLSTSTPDPLL